MITAGLTENDASSSQRSLSASGSTGGSRSGNGMLSADGASPEKQQQQQNIRGPLQQRMHVRTAPGECHVAFAITRWDETRSAQPPSR